MKKLLLVALMGLGLAVVDAEARYRNCNRGSCNTVCEPVNDCGQPPCCEREETITVRVPAQKVCGWVCPTGACEVPYDQARHVTQD